LVYPSLLRLTPYIKTVHQPIQDKSVKVVIPNLSEIQWKKYTSKNGKTFEVGTRKTEDSVEGKANPAMAKKLDNTTGENTPGFPQYGVWWAVGDDTWKTTQRLEYDEFQITRWDLTTNSWYSYYDYILYFTNDGPSLYEFFDESGDSYSCITVFNGDHYVAYNSDRPNIYGLSAWN